MEKREKIMAKGLYILDQTYGKADQTIEMKEPLTKKLELPAEARTASSGFKASGFCSSA